MARADSEDVAKGFYSGIFVSLEKLKYGTNFSIPNVANKP